MKTFGQKFGNGYNGDHPDQGPVSRKSRNFTGHFRVSQFPLYLKNGEDLSRQTLQLFFFLLPCKHFKRSALRSKRLAVSQMAFRARKVFGTFEKRAPGDIMRWRATNYPLFYTICCHMTSRDNRICDIVESFEFGIL